MDSLDYILAHQKELSQPRYLPEPPGGEDGALLPRYLNHFLRTRTYQSESDEYSKVAATALQADLLRTCPLFRERTTAGHLSHAVNGCIHEYPQREEWDGHAWDLVAGPTAEMRGKGEDQTPRRRLARHDLGPSAHPELHRYWDRPEHAVHRAHMAVEIKASFKKANPTVRLGEFALARRWIHEFDPRTLAIALYCLEASDPNAQASITTLLKLKRRTTQEDAGLDALMIVPVGPKAHTVELPEDVRYLPALQHLAARYAQHWS